MKISFTFGLLRSCHYSELMMSFHTTYYGTNIAICVPCSLIDFEGRYTDERRSAQTCGDVCVPAG
jgi:hypothetical protein